uniref:Uncharacterized protein n=1 Tax=viral metagenome TaxID=1070528 RepID=A0A6C0JBU0_9ZZZZ
MKPVPVRVVKGHVIMSDESVVDPSTMSGIANSLKDSVAESYNSPVALDRKRNVVMDNGDVVNGKVVGAVVRNGHRVRRNNGNKDMMEYNDDYSEKYHNKNDVDSQGYRHFKKNSESMDYDSDYLKQKEIMAYKEYMRRKEAREASESYSEGFSQHNNVPSPFHASGQERYFPVAAAYGDE